MAPFVLRGWGIGGGVGEWEARAPGSRVSSEQCPQDGIPGWPWGPRKPFFLLETSSTADATARTVLTGQTVQTIRVGAAHFWRRREPDFDLSLARLEMP